MPIYTLKCKKCGKEFDFYKIKESSQLECPDCGNKDDFEKLPGLSSVIFKGIGWGGATRYTDSVDPCAVERVKRVDDVASKDKELYKNKKKK